jgi:hypothetical protein
MNVYERAVQVDQFKITAKIENRVIEFIEGRFGLEQQFLRASETSKTTPMKRNDFSTDRHC